MSHRIAAVLICAISMLLTTTACTSDDDPGSGAPGSSSAAGTGSGTSRELATTASLGRVTGQLAKPVRAQIKSRITRVVDAWLDAAYLAGEYPRSSFKNAFPHFTSGAVRRARNDSDLMSNAAIGSRIDSVRAVNRRVKVDVLAVERRPVAVTARVVLGIQVDGELKRRERIAGSLYLTYGNGGWQVFGYDMTRGVV